MDDLFVFVEAPSLSMLSRCSAVLCLLIPATFADSAAAPVIIQFLVRRDGACIQRGLITDAAAAAAAAAALLASGRRHYVYIGLLRCSDKFRAGEM